MLSNKIFNSTMFFQGKCDAGSDDYAETIEDCEFTCTGGQCLCTEESDASEWCPHWEGQGFCEESSEVPQCFARKILFF